MPVLEHQSVELPQYLSEQLEALYERRASQEHLFGGPPATGEEDDDDVADLEVLCLRVWWTLQSFNTAMDRAGLRR